MWCERWLRGHRAESGDLAATSLPLESFHACGKSGLLPGVGVASVVASTSSCEVTRVKLAKLFPQSGITR